MHELYADTHGSAVAPRHVRDVTTRDVRATATMHATDQFVVVVSQKAHWGLDCTPQGKVENRVWSKLGAGATPPLTVCGVLGTTRLGKPQDFR
jgi:hypothetical protein